uniref:Si:ch211-180f4.1 n=1 Tax=Labrus bergylta TaxID=56723 RepID=A0A3Q3MW13_9LABR
RLDHSKQIFSLFCQVSSMGLTTIEELEDFSLRNLSSLEELYMNHNRISSIGPKAFAGNHNNLKKIDQVFPPVLEILMIGENPILGLEEKNFMPLSRLHSLVLAGMGLSLSFYDNRLRWVRGLFLDLNRNPISRVQQGDFQNLQHLEELRSETEDFPEPSEIAKLEICSNPRLSYIDPLAFSDLSSLRTLLLHSNQLGLLSGDLLSSLPALEEVSLHSNPLRCDCLSSWGPHLGNQSHLKLLESSITVCSSPPHLIGKELQEVVAQSWGAGGANSCLPHISPHAFPPAMNVSAGQPITLECWADADPAPQFYWVTPTGDKVRQADAQVMKSCFYFECLLEYLLPFPVQVVHAQSVQDAPLPLPRWTSATVHIDNPQISYTAKVPVDVQEYNLTHLLPATEYHVCLTVSSSSPNPTSSSSPSSPVHTSCLNVTTKEAGFSVEMVASRRSSVALAAVMGSMFALSIMALLVVYMGRRVQQHKSCGHSLKKYMQHATSIPLNELYPPLITLWESEEEAGGSQIDTTKTYMW